jgi:hypothetical protein
MEYPGLYYSYKGAIMRSPEVQPDNESRGQRQQVVDGSSHLRPGLAPSDDISDNYYSTILVTINYGWRMLFLGHSEGGKPRKQPSVRCVGRPCVPYMLYYPNSCEESFETAHDRITAIPSSLSISYFSNKHSSLRNSS